MEKTYFTSTIKPFPVKQPCTSPSPTPALIGASWISRSSSCSSGALRQSPVSPAVTWGTQPPFVLSGHSSHRSFQILSHHRAIPPCPLVLTVEAERWSSLITPICNNFNENVCTYPSCMFLHICSTCKEAHPRSVCPRRVILARSPAGDLAKLKNFLSIHPSTPINISALAAELSSHPDSVFTDYLLTGLSQGFRVGILSSPVSTFVAKNLQSAIKDPATVSQLLNKELNKGYIIGPFDSPPFPVFNSSPVGIATRKYSGKKRLIFDLSAPHSGPVSSINSLIPPVPFSLHYATVDNAIRLIKLAVQGAWLSKADITDAFKIIPIHPSQWHCFGVKWDAKFYFAVRLTFGCRSSPCIFNSVSEALCWILLNNVRLPAVLHLLDDFLLIDPPNDSSGSSLLKLKKMFSHLGVPLSDEKTLGPAKKLEFLGISLDTCDMKASLPKDKLQRIRQITQSFSAAVLISKQELLSLLGHLNFAMRVILQGRSFISRLLALVSSVPNLHDLVSLDEGCRSDLKFWAALLDQWNGISFFYDDIVHSSESLQFFTDAAPSVGFGGFFQGQWFASSWPTAFPEHEQSSALFEIYPIAVACHIWGHLWQRKRISVLCDNEATVNVINKGRSSSGAIMPFMRCITWLAITHNFILTARHVPGHFNIIADSLSRFKFQIFCSLCPDASPNPTPVPPLQELVLF
ncbi:uncharacterized protein LOC108895509 [Lates calcarifer]|uniref:ribonuclease H n=1 Tax=Lates calcarifer TaxID=8187 RepID=A0AAJ7VEM7_LATCA|nr:uncharacterized protein LOC108895509 [Lates calcarifer]